MRQINMTNGKFESVVHGHYCFELSQKVRLPGYFAFFLLKNRTKMDTHFGGAVKLGAATISGITVTIPVFSIAGWLK